MVIVEPWGRRDTDVTAAGRSDVYALLRLAVGSRVKEEVIASVAESADEWEAHRGEVLIDAGHVAPQGFLVLSGTVSLVADGSALCRLAPGSAIWPGEGVPMPFGVVADGRTWLLLLAPSELAILSGD